MNTAPYRPMTSADLTEEEIAHICKPLTQGFARTKFLRSLGLHVDRRPDGQPLVNRAHYDVVRGGGKAAAPEDTHAGPIWGVHGPRTTRK